jgi:hypothetical protein
MFKSSRDPIRPTIMAPSIVARLNAPVTFRYRRFSTVIRANYGPASGTSVHPCAIQTFRSVGWVINC